MRIAILGATSEIAKDLILSFCVQYGHQLVLFARRPEAVMQWLTRAGLAERYAVADFSAFGAEDHFDAVLNFVGVGNPVQAKAMGASIFDITLKYDELALAYVKEHPQCRYIFLSSGAAYGSNFDEPVNEDAVAHIPINNLPPQGWYGVAKLHAECRHRSLLHLPIVDIRVFNYFSHSQDMSARFLITDIFRAIQDNVVLRTSAEHLFRDYIHPSDFCSLIDAVIAAPPSNAVLDAYSKAPIDKFSLLVAMHEKFGLKYEIQKKAVGVNATGSKPNYYSLNTKAAEFGYMPKLTSLEGLLMEAKLIIA